MNTYTLVIKGKDSKDSFENMFLLWAKERGIELEYLESGDKTNRDFFAVTRWHDSDVGNILEEENVVPSKVNIEKVKERKRVLEDRSVEEGWEILQVIVSDLKYDGEFE